MNSASYGLITGRVSSLAFDPSDTTGNHLYLGTTGGGVWEAQNAAVSNGAQAVFRPLTDAVGALNGVQDPSISIGALTVQPGGTGVMLAGTGDPNDALDSYYGAGVLRSADGGNSWSLNQLTADGLFAFVGEGFAGFAWSTVSPNLVVAAVSQAYEATLVNAVIPGRSFEGLYYSTDAGTTWTLATITDGGTAVQGASITAGGYDGNAATSVVWNPVRQLFVAAVRYHGYYSSADGITFTRLAAQPGTGLFTSACPANTAELGSVACPIFRGTLAVNPLTGDTFAWTVDGSNQDQGLWQDQCGISGSACSEQTIGFGKRWNTQALETNTGAGAATIANGDYNLALAAVPYALQPGADTWLFAGANDLWRCSLAAGCVWRNTTNAATCMSGRVAPFQHALAWSGSNPLEIMIGNDGGLWRSLDAVGETGPVCSSTDASHFQNLNGGLGSLAEVESLAVSPASQYNMIAGLGVNGTAGLKASTAATQQWPEVLSGYGGPAAIDPRSDANWYVNNQAGVSIYWCSDPSSCDAASFGTSPAVDDADVDGDGDTMTSPAPFLVDPLDPTQLLIGTCRVWRGPADGVGWSGSHAVSPIFDTGSVTTACSGDALIRSLAALPLAGGGEVVYAGTYGTANGGQGLPGHVLSATVNPSSATMPVWQDLTANPVTNSTDAFNAYGHDISSISVDSHDATGKTVYATVEGIPNIGEQIQTIYRSTDGGAHWASVTDNLPDLAVNGLAIDPQSASTVYIATDEGVYFTTAMASCTAQPYSCWTVFGTGLPDAPVVELQAAAAGASAQVLTAGTYGRGVWQTALWTATTAATTATVSPTSLTFGDQVYGTTSTAKTVTLTNTGSLPLTVTTIAMAGDFSETDNCANTPVAVNGHCDIGVAFTPSATGSRNGQMTIGANVYGGQLNVSLSGTGTAAGAVNLSPATVSFGQVADGTTSSPLPIAVGNSGSSDVPITGLSITAPFVIASNACGVSSLAAESDCQISVEFVPTGPGAVAGTLTLIDGAGTQTVTLNGTGAAPPTDGLNPSSVSFPATAVGTVSPAQTVLLTNTGDETLTGIGATVTGGFQVSNTCGTQLAGHSACSIDVVFAPVQVGMVTGTLTVSDALRTQTAPLSGTGAQQAVLTPSPASLTFPAGTVGVASLPRTVTVTNTGGVGAATIGFQVTGPAAASFATGTTTCMGNLASGTSCTVQVIFTPTQAGGNVATLTITSSTLGVKAATVAIDGAAMITSGLNVIPAQLAFASTVVGATSAGQQVVVSNTSSFAANGFVVAVTSGFALTQDSCTASLAAGASCTVQVVFKPTTAGAVAGSVTITSGSIGNTATVALSGTGALAAGLQVAPPAISFPVTGVGMATSPVTVTVTNTGTEDALSNLALKASAGFRLVDDICAGTLAPGASCTTGVEFAPTVAGAQTGLLTVTTSTVAAPQPVALSGTGFDFTVTFSGSNTQTIADGQTADYTLVITPLGNGSGTFSFACDSLPTGALCLFNPPGETLNSGVTGNATLSVSTSTATAARYTRKVGPWAVLPLLCGLLLLPFGRGGLSGRAGWWSGVRMLAWLALSVAVLSGLGCTKSGGGTGGGGSKGGSGGTGGTGSGTYTIPVTVSSGGVSHTVTVTLIVD